MMIKKIYKFIKRMIYIYSNDDILIYQMGKVGSSSIEKSLNILGISNRHIHSFGRTNNYRFNNNVNKYKKIKNKIIKYVLNKRKKKCKIITLMRDPISRNLSALFQELHTMLYDYVSKNNRKQESFNEMVDIFLNKYIDQEIPLIWFNEELKYFTGIDIFQYDFDKELGYMEVNSEKFDILVLTAEKLNQNKMIISEFIDNNKFEFYNTNLSSNKWYSELYKNYKKDFKATQKDIDKFYGSTTLKFFYSEEDIRQLINKWT